MKIKKIIIPQPAPQNNSPYDALVEKHNIEIEFTPFFKVVPVELKELKSQKIDPSHHSAIVFTSKSAIDVFFAMCEEMKFTVAETMKYICISEPIALYLQKYIVYRKRKIFFGNGTPSSIVDIVKGKHKDENFLLTATDNCNSDLVKLFKKSKLKYSVAVLLKTVFCDLSKVDIESFDVVVLYSPFDIASLLDNFPNFNPKDKVVATFGNATLKRVKELKWGSEVIAPTEKAPSIAQALSLYLEQQ